MSPPSPSPSTSSSSPAAPRWRALPATLARLRRTRVLIALLATGATIRLGARLLPHDPLRARIPLSTAVTARDGTLLRLTLAPDGQYRRWTPLEEISPLLIQATLLYEDRHFHHHFGVNPLALIRAALSTYGGGARRVGGSTLTMQLARRLWSIPSRTPSGKVMQILRALELEGLYSKHDLLEAYLNLAPYGGNIEGAGAASALYFHKSPADLTLGEALTLAVVPQSPTRRAAAAAAVSKTTGASAADGALDRARAALHATWIAHQEGSGVATATTTRGHLAAATPTTVDWPRLRDPGPPDAPSGAALPFLAPHFVDHLLDLAHAEPAGGNATVATTLDLPLQRLCERHLHAYVARQRARGIGNAAALLVDARTMAVRALVGSADFFDDSIAGQVNGALAPRSPGSTLKPFVYALGLDQGVIHPATMLRDVPTAFAAYSPENFDGRFVGPLSARDALIRSRNVPALSVAARISRPNLYDLLKTSGAALPFPESHYGLGLVLGTGEVTMEDLARLYGALANRGVSRSLVWRAPDERARRSGGDAGVRLMSDESAFLVVDMLLDNPAPGARHVTVASARPVPVAWKTGTSWGFRDAWAVGLFGSYVLAVWVGDFSGAGNPAFVGAEAAGPLFFQIIDSIAARDPGAASFEHTPPAGVRRVEVCTLSGGLPTAYCPHRRRSWFIPGRSPIEPCALHRDIALDDRGRRTCPAGPPAVQHEVFDVWPSDLAQQLASAGLPRRALPPPAPGCEDAQMSRDEPPRITSPLAGVTYKLRARDGVGDAPLALQAVTAGDSTEVFWFAGQTFIGKAARGQTIFWRPPAAGHFTVRAVDDLGRADVREVATEMLR